MKAIFSIITFSMLIFACNSPEKQETAAQTTQSEAPTVSESVVDDAPPNFPIYTSYDQISHIFKYENDTTYVINFWATWCKPCVEELPYFEKLNAQYKNQKVKVILVSLDFAKQLQMKLVPFVKEQNLQSDVIALVDGDYNSWIDKVNPDWDGAIPVTMIYNKKDRQFVSEQFESYADLESILKEVLLQ
ncbi:MAG: thiol-disulfide isomerase/thioredoxin [Paraglaciecola sp.]|jgi:thiol-disulfide isomerase/thioredoxin